VPPARRSNLGAGVAGAETEMLDVVDRLVEQRRHMVVIEPVDDAASLAVSCDEAEVAQQPQLVGDGGLFHPYRGRQVGH
jgi:hypothetical protein